MLLNYVFLFIFIQSFTIHFTIQLRLFLQLIDRSESLGELMNQGLEPVDKFDVKLEVELHVVVKLLEPPIHLSQQPDVLAFRVPEILKLHSLEVYCHLFVKSGVLFGEFVGLPFFELKVVELGVFEFFEHVQDVFVHDNGEEFLVFVCQKEVVYVLDHKIQVLAKGVLFKENLAVFLVSVGRA
jgi:hypothetical protein